MRIENRSWEIKERFFEGHTQTCGWIWFDVNPKTPNPDRFEIKWIWLDSSLIAYLTKYDKAWELSDISDYLAQKSAGKKCGTLLLFKKIRRFFQKSYANPRWIFQQNLTFSCYFSLFLRNHSGSKPWHKNQATFLEILCEFPLEISAKSLFFDKKTELNNRAK